MDVKFLAPRSAVPRLQMEQARLCWVYFLVAVPFLTDLLETGRLPVSLREWVTEAAAGAVIAVLVRKVRKEYFAVLRLARSDPLTGLWNRRAFEETIEDECARARRSQQPLSLIYIDLDNFKQINDRAGHDAGDLVLQQLATAIRHVVRAGVDRGFRLGGDEFALLLPGSLAEQAEPVVTRIREHCARSAPVWVGGPLGITAGIVELEPQESASDFMRRADAAMYLRKQVPGAHVIHVGWQTSDRPRGYANAVSTLRSGPHNAPLNLNGRSSSEQRIHHQESDANEPRQSHEEHPVHQPRQPSCPAQSAASQRPEYQVRREQEERGTDDQQIVNESR